MNTPTLVTLEMLLGGTGVLLAGFGGAIRLARSTSALRSFLDRSPVRTRLRMGIGAVALMATMGGLAIQPRTVAAAATDGAPDLASRAMEKKAVETIIPTLDFFEATPAEALKAISASSGLQVHYTPGPADKASLTLKLANVPASEALKYVAGLANLMIAYRADGVYLQSAAAPQKGPAPRGTVE